MNLLDLNQLSNKIRHCLITVSTIKQSELTVDNTPTNPDWTYLEDMFSLIKISVDQFELLNTNKIIDDFKTCFKAINYTYANDFIDRSVTTTDFVKRRNLIRGTYLHDKLIRIGKRSTMLINSFRNFSALVLVTIIKLSKLNRASKLAYQQFMINIEEQVQQGSKIIDAIQATEVSRPLLHVFGGVFPPTISKIFTK